MSTFLSESWITNVKYREPRLRSRKGKHGGVSYCALAQLFCRSYHATTLLNKKQNITYFMTTKYTGSRLMRIHLVQNSTSARFEKIPKIFI